MHPWTCRNEDPDGDEWSFSASGVGPAHGAGDSGVYAAGARVGQHLRLTRSLGAGGMGSVWAAEHVALRMPVAVKFLRSRYASSYEAVARLRREAAAAARIRSPHVVQVFDLQATDAGVPYMVMELLEGESLEDYMGWRGRLSLDETCAVVRQVGAALAKAHDLGVVHRDIKPDNIFLLEGEREMFVKVLDFGIALDLSEGVGRLTSEGAVVGTPHFMAPEQMMGSEHVGPAADVWALGVVAYRCLTQRLPYEGESVAAMAVAVDRGPPEPPSKFAPELPPAIDAWMARALEPRARDRFRDGREMVEALEEALAITKGDRSRVPTVRDGDLTLRYRRAARRTARLEAATLKMTARRGPAHFLAASIVVAALLIAVWLGWSSPTEDAATVEAARAASGSVEP